MSLPKLFQRLNTARQIVHVSRELAIASSRQVWQSVAHLVLPSSRAEARGYIRAKTTPIVEGQLDAFYRTHKNFDSGVRTSLGADVTERVVRLVLDEFSRNRAIATTRKAA